MEIIKSYFREFIVIHFKILSMILEILISAVSVELTEWEADVIIHIANCSLEDILIATLLAVVEDFR